LLGAALLVAVVITALHFSEGRDFAIIFSEVKPWWLALAFLLQAATYSAQGEVFHGAPCFAGFPLPRLWLFQLSFGKLFLDQALPSGGISSAALAAAALEQRGVARGAAVSSAVISIASYYGAYVVALAVALIFATFLGHTAALILVLSALFLAFSLGLMTAILILSGRRPVAPGKLSRIPMLSGITNFLEDTDPKMVRNPKLLTEAVLWQLAIILLDAATMWVLIRSLGAFAPAVGVFVSFMVSNLFRTMGIIPGGLGTYEATAVITLRTIGVSIPVALSATLLFRGLSFWLPMLPGLWFSRKVTRDRISSAPCSRIRNH
jgi:Mg2+-importing ATPase